MGAVRVHIPSALRALACWQVVVDGRLREPEQLIPAHGTLAPVRILGNVRRPGIAASLVLDVDVVLEPDRVSVVRVPSSLAAWCTGEVSTRAPGPGL